MPGRHRPDPLTRSLDQRGEGRARLVARTPLDVRERGRQRLPRETERDERLEVAAGRDVTLLPDPADEPGEERLGRDARSHREVF